MNTEPFDLDATIRSAMQARPEHSPGTSLTDLVAVKVRSQIADRFTRYMRRAWASNVAAAILLAAVILVGLSRVDWAGWWTPSEEAVVTLIDDAGAVVADEAARSDTDVLMLAGIGFVCAVVWVAIDRAVSLDSPTSPAPLARGVL